MATGGRPDMNNAFVRIPVGTLNNVGVGSVLYKTWTQRGDAAGATSDVFRYDFKCNPDILRRSNLVQ